MIIRQSLQEEQLYRIEENIKKADEKLEKAKYCNECLKVDYNTNYTEMIKNDN